MGISTLLDIFISRRCYAEKKADITHTFPRNICENESVKHLRETSTVACFAPSVLLFGKHFACFFHHFSGYIEKVGDGCIIHIGVLLNKGYQHG